MQRTIVIGDIHGCLTELKQLLVACEYDPFKDRILSVGDIIDRGPQIAETIDFLYEVEQRQESPSMIIGNHELNALKQLDLEGKKTFCDRIKVSDWDTAKKYAEWFESKAFIEFGTLPDKRKFAVVHGGIHPDKSVFEQRKSVAARIQLVEKTTRKTAYIYDLKKERTFSQGDWVFWGDLYQGEHIVLFGHTYFESFPDSGIVHPLDGGVCFGGELRAMILPEMRMVSIKSSTFVNGSEREGRHFELYRGCKFY